MQLETLSTILVAVAPAVTAAITIIAGLIKIRRMFKKDKAENMKQLEMNTAKMNKSFDDIARLTKKVESIEKYLLEEKERKK